VALLVLHWADALPTSSKMIDIIIIASLCSGLMSRFDSGNGNMIITFIDD
jgi:hypothetical protein